METPSVPKQISRAVDRAWWGMWAQRKRLRQIRASEQSVWGSLLAPLVLANEKQRMEWAQNWARRLATAPASERRFMRRAERMRS